MQPRQRVVGHHREHVMFDVVVHVPVDPAAERVHQDSAGVQAVVEHVLGQPAMLQKARHDHVPRAVDARPADQHQGQKRPRDERESDGGKVDGDEGAGPEDRLGQLRLGDVVAFVRAEWSIALRTSTAKCWNTSGMPMKASAFRATSGGRMKAISGSRPTMIVSVWWRAWDQRQLTGLRMTMKLASA
jgi:hypothetical protein